MSIADADGRTSPAGEAPRSGDAPANATEGGRTPLEELLDLARRPELYRGELRPALGEITGIASRLLDVDRVNVWVFEEDGGCLTCLESYPRDADEHVRGRQLRTDAYPEYIAALTREVNLAVDDARDDPRTGELREAYLEPEGIGALVAAPIRREGEMVGVISHEHAGGPRTWTDDERHRAGLVADFVALALEARRRREVEEKYRNLFDLSYDMVFLLDAESGRFLESNEVAEDRLGFTEKGLTDLTYRELHPEDALDRAEEAFGQALAEGRTRFLSSFVTSEGASFPVEITARRLTLLGRDVVQAVARDMSDWVRAQEQLRTSERRYRELFERNVAGVFRTTPGGEILEVNAALARMLGYESPQAFMDATRGEAARVYDSQADRDRIVDRLVAEEAIENYEIPLRRKDGGTVWVLENSALVHDPTTGQDVIEGTLIDITERKRLEEELERMAYHDSLTGLANRRLLQARAGTTLALARRGGYSSGMVYLDLVRFKRVNDTLGHAVGDRVLVETARRLERVVREADTVARVGGDEFAVLLSEVESEHGARKAAERLRDALEPPVTVDDDEIHLDARLGVALFPEHADEYDALLSAADAAMYATSSTAGPKIHLYEPAAGDSRRHELTVEGEIRRALDREEFLLYYQPIVRSLDGGLEGAEALLRWNHPERGLLAAGRFIHLAERAGLMRKIDRFVMRRALRQMASWEGAGRAPGWVAVNLSAASLRDHGFPEALGGALEEAGVDGERLMVEVTERTAMRNPEVVTGCLRRLRALGVKIALDDFGTGHSALAYLKQLPTDLIKMDGVFIQDLEPDGEHGDVARAIISLGREVGLSVAAERVESETQRAWLKETGCELLQGYHMAEPVPPEELFRDAPGGS